MSIIKQVDLSNLKDVDTLTRFLNPFCGQVSNALNKGLSFQDNMQASIINVAFPSTVNQNLQIAHKLSVQPIGYVAIRLSAAGIVYDGTKTVLGATFANLKCNVSGMTATLLFF